MNTKEHKPVTEKTGRHCYAYIITIGERIHGTKAVGWWAMPDEMQHIKSSMATAARCFKKTAGVLVYELCEDETGNYWHLCNTCNVKSLACFVKVLSNEDMFSWVINNLTK